MLSRALKAAEARNDAGASAMLPWELCYVMLRDLEGPSSKASRILLLVKRVGITALFWAIRGLVACGLVAATHRKHLPGICLTLLERVFLSIHHAVV